MSVKYNVEVALHWQDHVHLMFVEKGILFVEAKCEVKCLSPCTRLESGGRGRDRDGDGDTMVAFPKVPDSSSPLGSFPQHNNKQRKKEKKGKGRGGGRGAREDRTREIGHDASGLC